MNTTPTNNGAGVPAAATTQPVQQPAQAVVPGGPDDTSSVDLPETSDDESISFVLDAFDQLEADGDGSNPALDRTDDQIHEEPVVQTPGAPLVPGAVSDPALQQQPQPQAVAPTTTQTPAQPTTTQPAVQATAQTPQAPVQTPAQVTAPAAPAEDGREGFSKLLAAVQASEDTFTAKLAETVYKVDDALAEELESSPKTAIPKLQARQHVAIVKSVLHTIIQSMPGYVAGHLEARRQHDEAENSFYGQWPQIERANPQHRQAVEQISRVYRQLNPNADTPTAISMIGAQVVMALKLPTAAQPAPRQTNQVRTPGPVVRRPAPAFTPAGANTAPAGPQTEEVGTFGRMAEYIYAEDQGAFDRKG